jgi:pyruvate dehydrogenase (quinone)
MSKRVANVLIETLQLDDRFAAVAETVSSPDASIPGTYLARIINKHAAEDALFTVDDGTVLVWTLRHIDARGKRRTFGSLLHGTMASGMPSAIGLQKCQPGHQVVCMAGDGGFTLLLGDLLTVVQENVLIKIVVFDNGKPGFIDIEQGILAREPVSAPECPGQATEPRCLQQLPWPRNLFGELLVQHQCTRRR